ncbi:MAG: TadE/TadG family type IV pilus assembly protein [Actinomycetota bacterium]
MRVRLAHLRRDDRGASTAIVALCLVALVGMVVLTIDVGGLMTMRRGMVNAADAAALAAAQSCAGTNPGEAPAQADALAIANVGGATSTKFQVDGACGGASGQVTVGYQAPQQLFFAPVLGFPDSADVHAEATAMWGAAGGGNTTPVMLDMSRLRGDCKVPETPVGTQCVLWYDSDLVSGQWGLMNLDKWNVAPGDHCTSAGTSARRYWILHGYPTTLTMAEPGPTYVCADSGAGDPVWTNALAKEVGKIKLFPVNDPSRQLVVSGKVDKYAISGFSALLIKELLKGTDPGAADSTSTSTSRGKCTADVSFPPNTVNLDSLGYIKGCPTVSPDTITNLKLKKGGTTYKLCAVGVAEPCYSYNPAIHLVTWSGVATSGVNVTFDWSKSMTTTTPGKCGPPPDGTPSNAFCLITEWRGYQTTAGPLSSSAVDLGVKAVRLSY